VIDLPLLPSVRRVLVGPRRAAAEPFAAGVVHESVFAKLVAIMVAMAASLLLLVGGFFWLIAGPGLNTSIHRVLDEYTRVVASTSPDLQTAQQLGARLGVQMRYEGPDESWSTVDGLPTIDDVRSGRVGGHGLLRRHDYAVVAAPNGGTYLFVWNFGTEIDQAHAMLLLLLLIVMVAVVLTTYVVLKHLLRPLRELNDGVARLGAGQLDVVVPNRTNDEFGRLTATFNRMVGRVREMIVARDQLLLDVSHELRSPLTRMKVALELLPPDEQRTRMAADVVEMERMIADLLELERLRGARGIRTTRQDLMPILREVTQDFQYRGPGARIVSTTQPVLADVDREQVRTVLRNLLENAAKYALPQSRPVEISAARNGDTVTIRVTDDGPGIPEEDVERVFEPFFRVDRSRSKSSGGYGLGLSICKRVMEAHGGSIALERRGGSGVSFVVTFPGPR
jgi:signal transduction histidine kinase